MSIEKVRGKFGLNLRCAITDCIRRGTGSLPLVGKTGEEGVHWSLKIIKTTTYKMLYVIPLNLP